VEGDDHDEAYTVIVWGVGLSHEKPEVAGAEVVTTAEGNMCGAAMRGTVALPGSEATSRTNGARWNLGDLMPPVFTIGITGRDGKSGRRSCRVSPASGKPYESKTWGNGIRTYSQNPLDANIIDDEPDSGTNTPRQVWIADVVRSRLAMACMVSAVAVP
jgi:hypothetical protein